MRSNSALVFAPGYGLSQGHHGEILQGVVELEGGLQRVLLTLPCIKYRSIACFIPQAEPMLEVRPKGLHKARQAALGALALLGFPDMGGLLTIDSNIPCRQGLGSSTADVIAVIRAIADAFGRVLTPEIIARLAVSTESASDALMFEDAAVLFAQRQGIVVERFHTRLPAMEILSIRDEANGDGVDTLAYPPPVYDWQEIGEFRYLIDRLRQGILDGDAEAIGHVATASARINQRFLNKPHLEEIEAIGRRYGALGIQVAHSGTAMGLLFRQGDSEAMRKTQAHLSLRKNLAFGWL
ncbi:MAG: hypothetical protein PHE55_22890 [Methylococcaceae bacterium]|nr:hypothetical protein [Methylococcaceae bacterium]